MKKAVKKALSSIIAAVVCLSLLPLTTLEAREETITQGDFEMIYIDSVGAYPYTGLLVTAYTGSGGDIVIPDNVVMIAAYMTITRNSVQNSMNITSVTIPDSVRMIDSAAFHPNTIIRGRSGSAAEEFANGNGNTFISTGGAIAQQTDQTNQEDTRRPTSQPSTSNVEFEIENGILIRYNGSDSNVVIPNGITEIGENFLFRNSNVVSVTIPDSVKIIGVHAFANCPNLTSVTIYGKDITFYLGAFYNTQQITFYGLAGSETEAIISYGIGYERHIFVAIDDTTPITDTTPQTPTTAPNLNTASAWAQDFINQAYHAELIPTTLQSSYTQATTRAEFAALAVTLYETIAGQEIAVNRAISFNDTTDISVHKAASIGIVSGMGDNRFVPNDPLTREQAAVMLARIASALDKPLPQEAATFADNGSISTWAVEAVGQIQAAGIMGGVGDNTFAPRNDYTREQSILTILRLFEFLK